MTDITDRLDRHNSLKSERINWDTTWQTVAELVDTRKADFTTEREEGTFLNTDNFDNTAQFALNLRSSTLVSLLWDGGKFLIRPKKEFFDDSAEENEWFEYSTKITQEEFKKAKADRIYFESELDEGAYGSSYLFLSENDNNDGIVIIPFRVRECYVDETVNNIVDTIYRHYRYTVKQMVDVFGIENVSPRTASLYNSNKLNDRIEILHIIQPRKNRIIGLEGKDNMPIESVYIELQEKREAKKGGIQGGFNNFPVFISREYKKNGEKYGRSPSMMAISDISQLNKTREDQIIILNRMADPAIGYYPQLLQGQILNTSPRSATPFRLSGRAETPVFDMIPTKGDANAVEVAILRLQESINSFYGIDRLLDFNTDTEMTLGESRMRAQIRQQSLGSLLANKRSEKYEPMVKRAFAILYNLGKFGFEPGDSRIAVSASLGEEPKIIPEKILILLNQGYKIEDIIDVEFYTQFELEKKLLENNTILQVWNNAGMIAGLTQNPEVYDNLDYDKTIKALGAVSVNIDIFRDTGEVEKIRDMRTQQQQAVSALQDMKDVSEISKNAG